MLKSNSRIELASKSFFLIILIGGAICLYTVDISSAILLSTGIAYSVFLIWFFILLYLENHNKASLCLSLIAILFLAPLYLKERAHYAENTYMLSFAEFVLLSLSGICVIEIWNLIARRERRLNIRLLNKLLLIASITLFAYVLNVTNSAYYWYGMGGVDSVVLVDEYRVVIKPLDGKLKSFQADAFAKINKPNAFEKHWSWEIPQYSIRKFGLFLKELYVQPPQIKAGGINQLTRSGFVQGNISSIKLIDFPSNSFHEAKNAENLKNDTYLDGETISWEQVGESNTIFAFWTPPYQRMRPLLEPFATFSSLSRFMILIVGYVIGAISTYIFQPVLFDAARRKFEYEISRKFSQEKRQEKKKIFIVKNGKIEEKEIDI